MMEKLVSLQVEVCSPNGLALRKLMSPLPPKLTPSNLCSIGGLELGEDVPTLSLGEYYMSLLGEARKLEVRVQQYAFS
jgi:hypothetical protein